jgi:hypothetical protein
MVFSGWPEEALDFYDGLAADNTKTYWTAYKAVYTEKILGPMTDLTEELAAEFGEPKIFRPYRDVRFSPDKTPYKTHIGAVIGGSGYVQLSAEGLGARRSPATARAPSSRRSSPRSRRRTSPSTVTARSSPRRAATQPTTPASRYSATRA